MAKNQKEEFIWSRCTRCARDTRHEILAEIVGDGGDEYHCWIQHAVIECRGCALKSFRYHFKDFEHAYPVADDEWEIPEEMESYPRFEDPQLKIDGMHLVPDIVASIYVETLSAIQEKAFILAGLGLRGTIEAVCNEQGISGSNLEKRIKSLTSNGLISKKDGERLHAIRFLGNDAAHEIKKPKKSQILVAVKIVKHLVASVYTLKHEAEGNLDTLISDYEEYQSFIEGQLEKFSKGDEVTINAIFGRDIRRIGDGRADLESRLIAEIQAGSFNRLGLGKVASRP